MSKHTPGPWTLDGNYVYGSNFVIAQVYQISFENPEGKANARLIAAAPEMFDVLKETLEVLESKEFKDEMGLASTMHIRAGSKGYEGKMLPISNIVNAISKAEGKDD